MDDKEEEEELAVIIKKREMWIEEWKRNSSEAVRCEYLRGNFNHEQQWLQKNGYK